MMPTCSGSTMTYIARSNNCYDPCSRNNCSTCNKNTCCYVSCCPVNVPRPCPVETRVEYIADNISSVAVPSGGTAIPAGSVIPTGSTAPPPGTVTVMTGFTFTPISNVGGIIMNNGFFTVPTTATYSISVSGSFEVVLSTIATDFREIGIYKVDSITGLVSTIALDSRTPITGTATSINVSAMTKLNANDRVFAAARQSNAAAGSLSLNGPGQIAIVKN